MDTLVILRVELPVVGFEAQQRTGEVIGGAYVLGEAIGVGAMGVVYAATQRSHDRVVAIKLPHAGLGADTRIRRKFRAEARAGARLDHRNIVRVLTSSETDGRPYLVMERVFGCGLDQLALERGRIAVRTAANIVGQILAGLDASHASGIVHADLKCEHILVEARHGVVPRIIDFGLSRFIDDKGLAGDGASVSGTPEYLAPELIRGGRPTVASDLYAAGVILYRLIAGMTPFAGGSSVDVMNRQLETAPMPLSARCPPGTIPAAIDRVIARALAKRPGDRFGDATELRTALLRATSGPPVAVSPQALTDSDQEIEHHRQGVADAIETHDADAIVVAYLDLARDHLDRHQLGTAILELERGLLLFQSDSVGPAWRLLLTLAALYDGSGDRARADITARAAREQAARTGSAIGCKRADALLERLRRPRNIPRASSW